MKPKSTKIYRSVSVKITVHEGWCKACGLCIEFCPKKVLVSNHDGKPVPEKIDECINCSLCELRCPDFAITVEEAEEKNESSKK